MSILPDTPYFDNLIDDFGIWQHTDETKILRAEGYSLDDAARGLIAALAYKKTEKAAVLLNYLWASKASQGRFYGFSKANREFIKNIASDDATGQVIWASGYCYKQNFKKDQAESLIKYTFEYALSFKHFRGLAYTLLGLIDYNEDLAKLVYDELMIFFKDVTDDWPWPEDKLTYGNGIIPYVLIKYGLTFNNKKAIKFGKKILLFLEAVCQKNRLLGPIGNEGWYKRGEMKVPDYSQQPIDAAYMLFAWMSDYKASQLGSSLEAAEKWFSWFDGNNILGQRMYNETDMRCYDGIDAAGVHKHSGAESNICFLMSVYSIETKSIF